MERNLLDTHTFLWYLAGDKKISTVARKAIEKSPDHNFVSIVSLWEIAIKISLGKFELHESIDDLKDVIVSNGFQILSLDFEDTLLVASLPFHHRDPFDRMIIAQASNRHLKLISKDSHFSQYKIETIW